MNTRSSRSHTIVQFTISSTTMGETVATSHLSSGGESIGTALDGTPTATHQRRRQHHPEDDDNNAADDKRASGDTRSDRENLHGTRTIASGGGGGRVFPVVTTRAKLSLVDLAGSEKGRAGGGREVEKRESSSHAGPLPTQGEDSREAQERERSRINSSLSALSNCISCLGEARRTHVPFRDNPLTR